MLKNLRKVTAVTVTDTRHIKLTSKPTEGQTQLAIQVNQGSTASPDASILTQCHQIAAITPQHDIQHSDPLPYNLHHKISLVRTPSGKTYAAIREHGNRVAVAIRSKRLNAIIGERARSKGVALKRVDIADLNDALEAYAEQYGEVAEVWLRVAPIEGGIEIDLGDDAHTRARITSGGVKIVESGSDVIFYRTATSKPMAMPGLIGDLTLLNKYLNMSFQDMALMKAWISYTLAHPKIASSKYPILVLQGNEGSGKTSLCKNIIIRLIDPSTIGVQVFPHNAKDLAIASQNAHVLCFDNLRGFKANMADMLCIAATGGTITSRQLYTDADQQAIPLHVALVLNGIHSFIDTPDLSQRCLPIHLIAMEKAKRKSEDDLASELEADLPAIMCGLFELIASILNHLPDVEITHPERMIDFVTWLAAMEKANGVPSGVYQIEYSNTLQQGQLDTLMDNSLAASIVEFSDRYIDESWSGTPAMLLTKLTGLVSVGTQRSADFPQNPIALSKRLGGLQAGLLSQGIRVELTRGKHRTITISKLDM